MGSTRILPAKSRMFYSNYKLIFSEETQLDETDILEISKIHEQLEDFENDNLVGREVYFQLEAALF